MQMHDFFFHIKMHRRILLKPRIVMAWYFCFM